MLIRALIVGIGAMTVLSNVACAHPEPSHFPDLSHYTPVNPNDYIITIDTPGISAYGTYFLTPGGVFCAIDPGMDAGCAGNNLPGIPPAAPTAGGTPRVNEIGTSSPIRSSADTFGLDGTIQGQPVTVLPPFHSLSVRGVTCGVDDKQMTACKDPYGRGFILSPSWSGWLPHV